MVLQDKIKKGVVYTCITGEYDSLINHQYVDRDWDYVCFTDNLNVINSQNLIWEIRPLVFSDLDDVRNQRWHKIHPHIIFPEYEKSLWLDANINILNSNIFDDIVRAIAKSLLISISPHPERNCIYDELAICVELGKDNIEIMTKQVDLFRNDKFPSNQGMFETSIMFRMHNDEKVTEIMNDWWWWISNYSRRDQLSLNYVLWKHNMKPQPLTEVSYRSHNNSVEFICAQSHITKEELMVQKRNFQKEIIELNNKISQKDREIEFIKSSKFWKLRKEYLKLKSFFKKNK